MLVTALNSTTETVDSLVRLAGGETLEGLLGGIVFLLEEVIISANRKETNVPSQPLKCPQLTIPPPKQPIESPIEHQIFPLYCPHHRSTGSKGVGFFSAYLKPSCRHPAALTYHEAAGLMKAASQGRRRMKGASEYFIVGESKTLLCFRGERRGELVNLGNCAKWMA